MLRFIAAITVLATITGCSGMTYHTDIDNGVLSQEIGTYVNKRDLQQFYSDQEAHESGATLLGRIEGESCDGDGMGSNNVSYNRSNQTRLIYLKLMLCAGAGMLLLLIPVVKPLYRTATYLFYAPDRPTTINK